MPSIQYNWTNAAQAFVVPANVFLITIEAWGAQGGGNRYTANGLGGLGGYVKCDLVVTPGETLRIMVGGPGEPYPGFLGTENTATNPGTSGGDGNAAGGTGHSFPPTGSGQQSGAGGGASDVRRSPWLVANRLVIAPGGGGASTEASRTNVGFGDGATPVGGEGRKGSGALGDGGDGGTQSAGGAGGTTTNIGSPGSLALGGSGSGAVFPGGGGGGGFYGGGGGSGSQTTATNSGAGGGGSGLSTGLNETLISGVQTGPGVIIVSYIEPSNWRLGIQWAQTQVGAWSL